MPEQQTETTAPTAPPREGTLQHAQLLLEKQARQIASDNGLAADEWIATIARPYTSTEYHVLAFVKSTCLYDATGQFHSYARLFRSGQLDSSTLLVELPFREVIWRWMP